MATVFKSKTKSNLIEVRTQGRTVRLYKNGVCHSDYNPHKKFNGAVWDLMFLAALPVITKKNNARVLVLGVGGGNVIHTIKTFFPNTEIIGVDKDSMSISIAKKYFGIDYPQVRLICEDAETFLGKKQKKFDIIIDDIFVEKNSEPVRAIPFDHHWYKIIEKNLSKTGAHIFNTVGIQAFKAYQVNDIKPWEDANLVVQYFKSPKCDNAVFLIGCNKISRNQLDRYLTECGILPLKKTNPFPRYQLRTLI